MTKTDKIMEQVGKFAIIYSDIKENSIDSENIELIGSVVDKLKAVIEDAIEVPVGWKLVPIKPTDEMLDATCVSQYGYINTTFKELADKHSNGIVEQIRDYLSGDYKAMLSASPEYKDKPHK
jgi:hypothetical protein